MNRCPFHPNVPTYKDIIPQYKANYVCTICLEKFYNKCIKCGTYTIYEEICLSCHGDRCGPGGSYVRGAHPIHKYKTYPNYWGACRVFIGNIHPENNIYSKLTEV